ncbi:MAG: HAD hydrolase-like protein [Bdellovibrionaceae bacterium]|nr:HAD hydrolase-like protein [Pseudobdellovibrionaceae bacterium]
MIEVIVFDLDDTLLDTSKLLIPIAGTPAFEARIRESLPPMPGAVKNLEMLQTKYELYLVTQGRVEFQRQKIASLGVASYFRECFVFEPGPGHSKGRYFAEILKRSGRPASHHLSVGNRRATDLREAKELGYQTCFFAHGEHVHDPVEKPEDIPDFEIRRHEELIPVCRL